jgi:hypothetical protein
MILVYKVLEGKGFMNHVVHKLAVKNAGSSQFCDIIVKLFREIQFQGPHHAPHNAINESHIISNTSSMTRVFKNPIW